MTDRLRYFFYMAGVWDHSDIVSVSHEISKNNNRESYRGDIGALPSQFLKRNIKNQ